MYIPQDLPVTPVYINIYSSRLKSVDLRDSEVTRLYSTNRRTPFILTLKEERKEKKRRKKERKEGRKKEKKEERKNRDETTPLR